MTVQPLHVASRTREILNRPELVCKLRAACQVSGVTLLSTSLGHVGFISLERYLAVRFPTRYKSFLSARRTVVGVTILWLLFLTYAILPVAGYRQVGSLTGRSIIMGVIVTITTACYCGTFLNLGASRRACALDTSRVSVAAMR